MRQKAGLTESAIGYDLGGCVEYILDFLGYQGLDSEGATPLLSLAHQQTKVVITHPWRLPVSAAERRRRKGLTIVPTVAKRSTPNVERKPPVNLR
jgi:hypothetical protein